VVTPKLIMGYPGMISMVRVSSTNTNADWTKTKYSHVIGSHVRADRWASYKATRNPTRNPRVDTTNTNTDWTKTK
jgi:hypothetical protein